jgi:hypothetical protein
MFTTLFITAYLFNQANPYGPKILIELLFIILGYVELHEIESDAK